MARKVRIEFADACYHVINRGNYRDWIFATPGARHSFKQCLEQVCEAKGWVLHAWVLMDNHYHLCVRTPGGNLVEGMRWLQSTFANRFNRLRGEHGHVFQGRYKAIVLDGNRVATTAHYIHLNPVRAGLVAPQQLGDYADSSFRQLMRPRQRWSFFDPTPFLAGAGGLSDSPAGRRSYLQYLDWLAQSDAEQRRLGFERMTRGWAQGAPEFTRELSKKLSGEQRAHIVEAEASQMRETTWEKALHEGLHCIGRGERELASERKGAAWKVSLARHLREKHLAPHRWIAERLCMGGASSVQSLVSRHRRLRPVADPSWSLLNS